MVKVAPVRIESRDDPRVADFRNIPDPVLIRERQLFVAEGRFVVRRLLASDRFRLRAVLVTPTAFDTLADDLADTDGDISIFVTSRALLQEIGGYDFHQGCLGLAVRPDPEPVSRVLDVVDPSRPLVVLERVGNPDNIGGIFRNAAAFGAAAVLLSPGCGDPLYRKAIRTSIGASLIVPYAVVDDWSGGLDALRETGYHLAALTPAAAAVALDDYTPPATARGIALILGNEGEGLSEPALSRADVTVRIPTEPAVDSLNVAVTAAIALHCLHRHRRGVTGPARCSGPDEAR